MLKKEREKIWKILNNFRMEKFIINHLVEIKIEEFDKMMSDIGKVIEDKKQRKGLIEFTQKQNSQEQSSFSRSIQEKQSK